MKSKVLILAICVLFAGFASIEAQTVRYVKSNGTGDGSSWTNASGSVQDMIDASQTGDEVWVAAGTYFPTCQTDEADVRSKTFLLKNGVHLYGSFAGTETDVDSRAKSDTDGNGTVDAWDFSNETVFSGNIDGVEDVWTKVIPNNYDWYYAATGMEGNCKIVVSTPDSLTEKTIFDGFSVCYGVRGIVTNGQTEINNCKVFYNYNSTSVSGSGISHNGEVKNSLIVNNMSSSGGYAVANFGGYVHDCYIANNVAHRSSTSATSCSGGGIVNAYPYNGVIRNCTVFNNHTRGLQTNNYTTADSYVYGGGISNGSGIVDKCLVMNNSVYCYNRSQTQGKAVLYGGGIYNSGTVSNCIIINNLGYVLAYLGTNYEGDFIRGIYNNTNAKVYNSVIANNASKTGISNVYPDERVINCISANVAVSAQHFVKPTSFYGLANTDAKMSELLQSDWRLKAGSEYIDAGSIENLPDWIINGTDFAGNPRIHNGKIDLGAYEYQGGNAIAEIAVNELQIIVAGDELRINLLGFQNLTGLKVQILNMAGRTVNIPFVKKMEYLSANISSLPTGVYIVRVGNQAAKFVRK
jgi:hypothetical protein